MMFRRVATLLSLVLLTTGLVGAQPASASYYGIGCYVVTHYGGGTADTGPSYSGGPGELTFGGFYSDTRAQRPVGFFYEFMNDSSKYTSGATSADYDTEITVNGIRVGVSPHNGYSKYYFLHGEWGPGWRDTLGLPHFWTKGDRITVIIHVTFHGNLAWGWTQGTCTL